MPKLPKFLIRNGIINKITIEIELRDRIDVLTLLEIAPDAGIVFDHSEAGMFTIEGHALEFMVERKKS